jgi:hypothetical protein
MHNLHNEHNEWLRSDIQTLFRGEPLKQQLEWAEFTTCTICIRPSACAVFFLILEALLSLLSLFSRFSSLTCACSANHNIENHNIDPTDSWIQIPVRRLGNTGLRHNPLFSFIWLVIVFLELRILKIPDKKGDQSDYCKVKIILTG